MTMFWIAWCYFGLAIVQITDTQRRAIVDYSYGVTKPSPTPTSAPVRSTTLAREETSINSISKLPTTASVLRGSSRGEMPAKVDRKKEPEVVSSLAKGDFASRERSTHNAQDIENRGTSTSTISSPRGPPRPNDEVPSDSGQKASILSGSSSEESDDRIYPRRVMPPGLENSPESKSESDRSNRQKSPESETNPRLDISPTKVYDIEAKTGSSRRPQDSEAERTSRDEGKAVPREYVDRDAAVPTRRDDKPRSGADSVYRDPEDDREYPRRYASAADRERSRYDDIDEDRGSRSRYDKRDRGRDSDDRYSKGDTRIYPEDRSISEDRSRDRVRERYPEDPPKRGDDDRYDDRYRDYDERPRSRDRDYVRPKERIPDDRSALKDQRYRDDDRYIRTKDDDKPKSSDDDRYRPREDERYRPRGDERYRPREDDKYKDEDRYRAQSEDRIRDRDDDRYRSRDDDRYISRDDDRYKPRDDDRYVSRDDDRYKSRDDDRYKSRDDDKDRSRDADDRYRTRDEDRYTSRDGDRYTSRDDDRYRGTSRISDDRYRSRIDEDKYVESRPRDDDIRETISRGTIDLPAEDRKSTSSGTRNYETVRDYDVGVRDRSKDVISPSRLSRPVSDEERYIDDDRRPSRYDDDRRPSRYDDDDRRISPTRTRIEDFSSRSTLVSSRPKEIDDRRYTDSERDNRRKDERYSEQDDRIRNTRIQDSRESVSSGTSRRVVDDRDAYQTRLPNERTERIDNSREEVVLDRRSYASEEDDEYRRKDSRSDYEDRSRRPSEDTRTRYRDEERYTRRDPLDDDEYKRGRARDSYDSDRTRSRDRYDDKYDIPDAARDDRIPPLPLRKYDSYPDEETRTRRRDPEMSTMRKEESSGRLRPSSTTTSRSEDRYYARDDYSETRPSSRRRYDDDKPISDSRDYKDDYAEDRRRSGSPRQPTRPKEPIIVSSMTSISSREPGDVVIREKRYQNTENTGQTSRIASSDEIDRERRYTGTGSESNSRDVVRPLSAKDVIESAMRHSDTSDQSSRKVSYPVFDPRVSNMTSPEIIRPNERRGTTITAKKRRSA